MTTIGSRVRALRLAKGMSQAVLAKGAGVSQPVIADLEAGRHVTTKRLAQIASTLGVAVSELDPEFAKAPNGWAGVIFVPLVGEVGSGAAADIDRIDPNGEKVPAPPRATARTRAVRVRCGAMLPWVEDGAVLFFSQRKTPSEMVNNRAIVQTETGEMYVKMIRRGDAPDLWTLAGSFEPDIPNKRLLWAAPIEWIDAERRS